MNFIANETAQKLRGGYYTPLDLAEFIARWVKEIAPKRILEPGCGDGIFFQALANIRGLQRARVTGFELNANEAAKANTRASELGFKLAQVHPEDFLQWAVQHLDDEPTRFDAVIGNPPYVRYQYLTEPFQTRAEQIFQKLRLPFTKHTNAWVPFVLAGMALLRPGGRLAMVIPAEIMHIPHAQSLRTYLGRECKRLVVIDPEELWFSDALQGTVILLAEKCHNRTDRNEGLGIYPARTKQFLKLSPSTVFDSPLPINGKTVEGKWTRALMDLEARTLMEELAEHKHIHRFENVAQVDVGIVTGANKFFLVPNETIRTYKLKKWAHPMFGRSEHCPGIIYDERQHLENAAKGLPTNFLWFRPTNGDIDAAAREYIKLGEQQELHTRYKCRVRTPWYTVPSVYSTKIGMLKRSHDTPRLILNSIGAYTTDTAYRIKTRTVEAEKLVMCFVNPLTALSAELEGRHYGGGVLELVPSEIERLSIPLPPTVNVNLAALDKAIRTSPMEEVLAQQSTAVLGNLRLSRAKQECLLGAWNKLRNRRQRLSSEPEPDGN